jgi:hypothetical protein
MARATPKIRHERPHISRPIAPRQRVAIRRLYRLNREFATDVVELQRKRRLRENALMASAVLGLIVMAGFTLHMTPGCTDPASAPRTILIGGAIKVAGC